MEIKKSSWIYRFVNQFFTPNQNRCVFFWQVLLAAFIGFWVMAAICLLIVICLGAAIIMAYPIWNSFVTLTEYEGTFYAAVSWVLWIALIVSIITENGQRIRRYLFKKSDTNKKEPGFFTMAKRTIIDRYCEKIDFID